MTSVAAEHRTASPRVAVIGGGISGLAAAHRLVEILPRSQLTLFEASSRLGGVLETIERDGYLVERSADNFLTTRPAAVALCERLGIVEQLLPTYESRRQALVVHRGRLAPIPAGYYLMSPRRLWPLISSPLLSVRGKLRLLAELLVPPRGRIAARNEIEEAARADESVASFVQRRFGREVYRRLVQPLVAGIYTADADQLSMAATMPEFFASERQCGSLLRATMKLRIKELLGSRAELDGVSGARYGNFVAPKHGMSSLIAAIVDRLPTAAIRLGTRVTQLRSIGGQWRLQWNSSPNGVDFDAVILALPSFAAASLLKSRHPALAAALGAIPYAGCAVVSCAFRRDQIAHSLNSFGFVVPQVEGRRIIAASFASNKFPGRAPAESVLIRTFVGGSLQPELADLPDNPLRRLVLDELAELLSIVGQPQWVDIARWPRSMPQYLVGHLTRVERIQRLAASLPRLALAGNAYQGVGIPQCIASGEAAAEGIAATFQEKSPAVSPRRNGRAVC
jgi:oxygen-dependent protoporphyrinogen oxidase